MTCNVEFKNDSSLCRRKEEPEYRLLFSKTRRSSGISRLLISVHLEVSEALSLEACLFSVTSSRVT